MANTAQDPETEGRQRQGGSSSTGNSTGGSRASFNSGGSSTGSGNSSWGRGFGSNSTTPDPSQLKQKEQQSSHNPTNGNQAGKSEGGASDNTSRRNPTSSGLKSREESPNESKDSDDSKKDDDDGGLWKQSPNSNSTGKKKVRFGVTRRRVAIGGVLAAMTVTGTAGWLSIVQGPGEIVQLGEILQNPLSGLDDDSSDSTQGLLRFARSGEYGETRLGLVGSKVFARTKAQLAEKGITFETNSLSNLNWMRINTSKLAENIAQLKGSSPTGAKQVLATELQIPQEDLIYRGSNGSGGHIIEVDNTSGDVKATLALRDKALGFLANGKIVTAIKGRPFAKFFDLPAIWSPIQRKAADVQKRIVNKAQSKKIEEERQKTIKPAESAEFQEARESIRSKLSPSKKLLSKTLLFTGGMCIIRSIAENVPAYNRGAIVVPAVAKTVDKIAFAAQIKGNKKIYMDPVGDMVHSFYDEDGKSIWSSKPLNALSDPTTTKGTDVPSDYAQGFSVDTTAKAVKDTMGGNGFGAVACSTPGILVQIAGSFLLYLAGPVSDGATWGVVAARFVGTTAATAGVVGLVQHQVERILESDTVTPEVLSGPLGGGLMALSSREFEGITSRSSGGVALQPADEAAIEQRRELASQQDFRNKSLFSQMYDKNDYRSVSSRLATSISPNMSKNLSTLTSNIFNLGGLLSHFSSIIMPKTQAASTYPWPNPLYGVPPSVKKKFPNPYTNGDAMAAILDGSSGGDYTDKAMDCWGVEVSKGDDGWQVVPQKDVNPTSSEYLDAHCNDLSDENWQRMIKFVDDSRNADIVDCYKGGTDTADQSCSNASFGGASTTASDQPDTTPTTDPGATVDTGNLTKDSTSIKCAANTKDLGTQDGYTGGSKVKIRICAVSNLPSTGEESNGGYGVSGAGGKAVVNSRVSGAVYAMVDAAAKEGVTLRAISSFRTMSHQQELCSGNGLCASGTYTRVAKPGTSNHQLGAAIDFADLPSSSGPIPGSAVWSWLSAHADKYGYKNYPAEAWHWSPTGS